MARDIEISVLDLRFESHRMKHSGVEGHLLQSILQRGIEEPLEGVDVGDRSVLLNGFKRYRCACKLHIQRVPYTSLGQDEAVGIMSLLRTSNNKSLSMLEQAGFLDELKTTGKMSVGEIATELCVSKAWVSVRLGLIAEMGPTVRRELFKGAFPVYVYMYSLRQLMRLNRVTKEQIEQFVVAVSGKKLIPGRVVFGIARLPGHIDQVPSPICGRRPGRAVLPDGTNESRICRAKPSFCPLTSAPRNSRIITTSMTLIK